MPPFIEIPTSSYITCKRIRQHKNKNSQDPPLTTINYRIFVDFNFQQMMVLYISIRVSSLVSHDIPFITTTWPTFGQCIKKWDSMGMFEFWSLLDCKSNTNVSFFNDRIFVLKKRSHKYIYDSKEKFASQKKSKSFKIKTCH